MLLKKYSYFLLAALMATSVACKDDDGGPVVDVSDPAINITSPTAGQLETGFSAGDSYNVTGNVTDNGGLQSVSLTVAAPNGGASWYTKNWTATQINGRTLEINETIDIPADAAAGTHVMTLRATDLAGNDQEQTFNVNILPGAGGDANATFNVTVPEGTAEDAEIYLVGTFSPDAWDSDDTNEAYRLTRNDDGTYSGNFMVPEGAQEFKFRLKAAEGEDAWTNVEMDADCVDIENRTITGSTEMQTMDFTVANWRNVTCTP